MHEYSIVASFIDRARREAAARRARRVHRLHIKLGELSGVEPEMLRAAYDTFRRRTVCDQADLAIEAVAAEWDCPSCHQKIARGAGVRCASCGGPARLAHGGEIVLDRIEMDVVEA